jgi:hypothetical protein
MATVRKFKVMSDKFKIYEIYSYNNNIEFISNRVKINSTGCLSVALTTKFLEH